MARDLRSETFEERGARCAQQEETGIALGDARWERGQRLTEEERVALQRDSMFGSGGYLIRKLGPRWICESPTAKGCPSYRTKHEATAAWEILLAIYRRLSGLEAQERALAEQQ